jgi:hypothetical protein
MKKGKMIWLAVVAAMVLAPTLCAAEMYVGLYGGINLASSSGGHLRSANNLNWDPTAIGGLKIGTWFVKEGTLGFNYPEWMKYFGFEFDFGYNRLTASGNYAIVGPGAPIDALGNQELRRTARQIAALVASTGTINRYRLDGECIDFAFMFLGRYGFFADSDVPFGRLQPYIGVGPAILVNSMSGSLTGLSLGTATAVNIALQTEAGVRYMALKNVSLYSAFRYRYSANSYDFHYAGVKANTGNITLNQFSFIFGAAYHF